MAPCEKKHFDFIFGNPPFLGAMRILPEQKKGMEAVFGAKQKMLGELDFVTAWFKKASDLVQSTDTRCAFVATNSITQGQQVPVLGQALNVEIDFAWRTFKWSNEAKFNAAVHCVIIGFHAAGGGGRPAALNTEETENRRRGEEAGAGGTQFIASCDSGRNKLRPSPARPSDSVKETPRLRPSVSSALSAAGTSAKTIYDSDGTAIPAAHINGYLCDAPDVFVESRPRPLCDVPPMNFGNMPRDGGNLILSPEERDALLAAEPQAAPLVRPLLGAEEFLHDRPRFCLWLVGASPALLKTCPRVLARVEACRQTRLASKAAATRKFAATPGLFCQITQPPGKDYIIVPCVSSERRAYVPIGFLTAETIVTNLVQIVPDATLYHFGVLTSRMHNAWMRAVAGRLKSDYRYSKDIVYNNFVWPEGGEIIEYSNNRIIESGAGGHAGAGSCERLRRCSATFPPNASRSAAHFVTLPDDVPTGVVGRDDPIAPQDPVNPVKKEPLRLCASALKNKNTVQEISAAAQAVLDARALYPGSSLADLYDPLTMPPELVKAHAHLDALVDRAYGLAPSCTDAERVAHLFRLYAEKVERLKGGKVEKCAD